MVCLLSFFPELLQSGSVSETPSSPGPTHSAALVMCVSPKTLVPPFQFIDCNEIELCLIFYAIAWEPLRTVVFALVFCGPRRQRYDQPKLFCETESTAFPHYTRFDKCSDLLGGSGCV